MDKSAVVFGGSGFLGSYVKDELTRRNYRVVVADQKAPTQPLVANESYIPCDILNRHSVEQAIPADCSAVFNFAGLADINDALNQPGRAMELNILANINILDACLLKKVGRFVYASSVYANSAKGSFYGISKLASEKIIQEYQRRFGLSFTIVRYGSIYGERADAHNGIYRMLRQAIEQGKIVHKGDGEEVREYIHAHDAASLSVDLIQSENFANQHITLTGMERMKQKDVLTMIKETLGDTINIAYGNEDYEGHYNVTPFSFQPDISKKLVCNPYIPLGQGLIECIRVIYEELNAGKQQ